LLEYGSERRPHHILIDGGTGPTYDFLRARIRRIPERQRRFELLIVTHVDSDHIQGIVRVLQDRSQLGLGQVPLTHDALHELQPWRAAAHLEELLMASGVRPAVDKYLCSFQRWLPGQLGDINDPEQARTIRLFATWRVLPRLRARAEPSHITPSVRRFAAEQVKYATAFLSTGPCRAATADDPSPSPQ
jgi:glyoxylase-like metal-dependent hydrolase (beta-lactamase superfamily II)